MAHRERLDAKTTGTDEGTARGENGQSRDLKWAVTPLACGPVLGHGARMIRRGVHRLRNGGAHHWAAPFVLAMLCLRAFVPAGFMLAPVDGQLQVVLCDTDARATGHHRHTGGHDASHHHVQTDPTCPYAQSSGPAPLPALPALAAVQIVERISPPIPAAQTHFQPGPVREQSPRGPPHLA
jgi:hypothetical protein